MKETAADKSDKSEKARIAKIRSDFMATLHGPNIFSHIEEMRKMKEIHDRYFRGYSPVYQAIVKHVMTNDDCVFFDEDTNSKRLANHRGLYPVHIKDTFIYIGEMVGDKFVKSDRFCMVIEVDLVEPDDDHMDYPPEFHRQFHISVPMDLELNFTQKKFNEWIADIKAKRDKEQRREDEENLERLAKKLGKKVS